MKNLENLQLQELTFEEQTNIDGGAYWWLIPLGLAALNTDWDKAGKDIKRGWNSI